MATHDVELAAACADRVVLLGEGQVVVDGPAREVMSDSQVFASQINKLFRDPRYLVVEDVLRALDDGRMTKDEWRRTMRMRTTHHAPRFAAPRSTRSSDLLSASIMVLASLLGLAAFLYPFFRPSVAAPA